MPEVQMLNCWIGVEEEDQGGGGGGRLIEKTTD